MDKDKRIAELIAENELLREALSPFAEVGGIYNRGHQSIPDENTTMICITVGELRRAYQVIHAKTDSE